ncbi:hypothetical protein ACHAXR_006577 [Thalassiosira sp. AJA248-18]
MMINNNKALQFGPERLILFHSPDPDELGLQLVHDVDGHVRISSNPSYEDEGRSSPGAQQQQAGIGRLGVVNGAVHAGDVVLEAAGVNMRRPISEHMWNLTLGLMRVAPRPIEIIVAEEVELVSNKEDSDDDEEEVRDADSSYFQLEAGGAHATVHHLSGLSPGARRSPGATTSPLSSPGNSPGGAPTTAVVRNPFQDLNRFGTERTLTFHTESLGIKLHRSPTEGIVHILHVTPYKPFVSGARNDGYKPPREGPDGGFLEAGDTIFEVGGVDLREKVIGVAEWADMVHFIKHVGRPLDLVVAKDKLFTRERAGLADVDEKVATLQNQVMEVQHRKNQEKKNVEEQTEKDEEQENVQPNVVSLLEHEKISDAKDDTVGKKSEGGDKEEEEGQEMQMEDAILNNVCFNVAADDICNLPCGGGGIADQSSSSPSKKDKPWLKKASEPTSPTESAPISSDAKPEGGRSPVVKDDSWIKKFMPTTPNDNDDNAAEDVPDKSSADVLTPLTEEGSFTKKGDSLVKTTTPAKGDDDATDTIKKKDNNLESSETKQEQRSPMPFYSRTHPTTTTSPGRKASIVKPASSPVQPTVSPSAKKSPVSPSRIFPAGDTSSFSAKPTTVPTDNMPTAEKEEKSSVAQLRQMFSPIQNPTSLNDAVAASPTPNSPVNDSKVQQPKESWHTALQQSPIIVKDTTHNGAAAASSGMEEEKSKNAKSSTAAELKGLFSPIVMEPILPKSPMTDNNNLVTEGNTIPANLQLPSSPPRQTESPSDWSVTSPYSDSSVAQRSVTSPADVSVSSAAAERSVTTSPMVSSVAGIRSAAESTNKEKDDPPKLPVSPSREKRNDLAQTIIKEKRGSPIHNKEGAVDPPASSPSVSREMQVPKLLEPTPAKQTPKLKPTPYGKAPSAEDANDTPFHSVFLENLKDEFHPDKKLQQSESRDDTDDCMKASMGKLSSSKEAHGNTKIMSKPEKRNHLLAGWSLSSQKQQQQRRDLSPAGSTVSVEDKKAKSTHHLTPPTNKKSNAVMHPFIGGGGGAESPFVGNIKFATPTQRVPQSSLFSQAFVVQNQEGNNADGEPGNVRWFQTSTPLFVVDDNADEGSNMNGGSSFLQLHSPRMQPPESDNLFSEPDVKGFNTTSAFDMTQLDKSIIDAAEESDSPSFELNETIVYADSTEDVQMDCCGVNNIALCGGENMFEGLVRDCGNMDTFRETKEKVNRVPSPRRKNLLSRLRNKGKKKSKANKNKVEYGNLDVEDEEQEEVKGVRKAHVQLAYQNIRGRSKASASQFALLVDDEICI